MCAVCMDKQKHIAPCMKEMLNLYSLIISKYGPLNCLGGPLYEVGRPYVRPRERKLNTYE